MSGAELFRVFCASCHGQKAKGDGPIAQTLKPKVPDLTQIAARNGGAFPAAKVRETIDGQTVPRSHGTRTMPVWGWDFRAVTKESASEHEQVDKLIDRLVEYLESIQK